MTCKDIEEKIPAYLEGTLSHEEKSLVEDHLVTCVQCSIFLCDLKKTVRLLKDLPGVEPPPWFTQKIMARVHEETEQKHGMVKRLFQPFHIKIPIEAFATLIVVIIGVYIYQSTAPETKTVTLKPQAKIQQTIPPTDPLPETKRTQKNTGETEGRSDFASLPSKEKAFAPAPPNENVTIIEQQQRPGADAPLTTAVPPAAQPARQKDILGAVSDSQPSRSVMAEKKTITTLSVQVSNVETAINEIERVLEKLGARNISRESRDGNEFINLRLKAGRIKELLQQLRTIGVVNEKEIGKTFEEDNTFFRIEIIRNNLSR